MKSFYEYKYTVSAFRSQADLEAGSDYDTHADTLKEAKAKARYCLTEAFRESGEMTTRFGYAIVRKTGSTEIVFDCFAK